MSLRMEAHGPLGCGKTLIMRFEMQRWIDKHPNCKIYSNIPIYGVPEYTKIDDPAIIFEIERDAVVLLDELWHFADSRKGMSVINDVMNLLLIRSRKRHWWVGFTQQHYKQTDLRIRYVTEIWIEPLMRGKTLRGRYYTNEGKYLGERYIDGSKYWGLYDSEADPFTLDIDRLKALYEKNRDRS